MNADEETFEKFIAEFSKDVQKNINLNRRKWSFLKKMPKIIFITKLMLLLFCNTNRDIRVKPLVV